MVVAHDVDQILTRAVEAGVVPGVVALAADDHGVIYAGAFGTRQVDHDREMSLDSVMKIASMTKAVTSVAAMQLVEQGRIGLDDPLSGHVPELAAAQVLAGFDDTGTLRVRPPRRPITLRHLLSHTAGFAYHMWNADLLRYHEYTGTPTIETLKKACLVLQRHMV